MEKSQARTVTKQRQPTQVRERWASNLRQRDKDPRARKDRSQHRTHGTQGEEEGEWNMLTFLFPSLPGLLENTLTLPQLTVVSFI